MAAHWADVGQKEKKLSPTGPARGRECECCRRNKWPVWPRIQHPERFLLTSPSRPLLPRGKGRLGFCSQPPKTFAYPREDFCCRTEQDTIPLLLFILWSSWLQWLVQLGEFEAVFFPASFVNTFQNDRLKLPDGGGAGGHHEGSAARRRPEEGWRGESQVGGRPSAGGRRVVCKRMRNLVPLSCKWPFWLGAWLTDSGVFPGQNFLLLGISHPIGPMPEIVLIKNLTKCL